MFSPLALFCVVLHPGKAVNQNPGLLLKHGKYMDVEPSWIMLIFGDSF